jgi:hypothetical protein
MIANGIWLPNDLNVAAAGRAPRTTKAACRLGGLDAANRFGKKLVEPTRRQRRIAKPQSSRRTWMHHPGPVSGEENRSHPPRFLRRTGPPWSC